MPPDIYRIYSPMALLIRLICHSAELQWMTYGSSQKEYNRRKLVHEKTALFKSTSVPGYFLFIERPLLTTTAAKHLASENYQRLHPCRLRKQRAISIRPKFFKIEQDSIQNITSTKQISSTTLLKCLTTTAEENNGKNSMIKKQSTLQTEYALARK